MQYTNNLIIDYLRPASNGTLFYAPGKYLPNNISTVYVQNNKIFQDYAGYILYSTYNLKWSNIATVINLSSR